MVVQNHESDGNCVAAARRDANEPSRICAGGTYGGDGGMMRRLAWGVLILIGAAVALGGGFFAGVMSCLRYG